MEKLGKPNGKRLVFVVCPAQGHINPILQLATILHSKGFSITIIHPQFNSPNPSNHPNFTFIPIIDSSLESKDPQRDFLSTVKALNKNCQVPFEICIKKMIAKEDSNDQVSCIIYDGVMHCAQTVANHLKLPGIFVRTSCAATLFAFAVVPHSQEDGYTFLLDSISEGFCPELESLKLKDIIASMKEHPTHPLQELRVDVTSAIKDSSAIIVNTMYYLEQEVLTKIQEYFHTSIFPIGPFNKLAPKSSNSLLKEDTSCISWLNRQAPNSVLYVSFGSMVSISENELLEVAWGLANSEQHFLWVLRPGLVRDTRNFIELLPRNFKERVEKRGYIVEWAPQQEVLANEAIGGFLTHCGWNSVMEGIFEGVPMLCKPFFGDQGLNMRYVCYLWRVGLEMENEFEREKIEKGIRRLMVDKEGEEVRQRAMEFKQKAKRCLIEGGSSYCPLNDLVEHLLSN